jgi:hypothetical protein
MLVICQAHLLLKLKQWGIQVKSKCLLSGACWRAVVEVSVKGCWWQHDIWSHVCSNRRHQGRRAQRSAERHVARSLIRSQQRHISLQLLTRYLSIDLRVMLSRMWSCVHNLLLFHAHSYIIKATQTRAVLQTNLATINTASRIGLQLNLPTFTLSRHFFIPI